MMCEIRKIQEQMMFCVVKDLYDQETALEIVYGAHENSFSEDNAAWVKSAMQRLESHFDKSIIKRIRMGCQCGYGMDDKLALVKELVAQSSSLEELAKLDKARAAGLSFRNGELFLQFPDCPCPMLADIDILDTDTWCQCTTGYSKVLFEKAFGCIVDVELIKSIKMGDEVCLMKILPQASIWG